MRRPIFLTCHRYAWTSWHESRWCTSHTRARWPSRNFRRTHVKSTFWSVSVCDLSCERDKVRKVSSYTGRSIRYNGEFYGSVASLLPSDLIHLDEYHISGNERWHAACILASFSSGRHSSFSAVILLPRCGIMFYHICFPGLHSQLLHYDLYAIHNLFWFTRVQGLIVTIDIFCLSCFFLQCWLPSTTFVDL